MKKLTKKEALIIKENIEKELLKNTSLKENLYYLSDSLIKYIELCSRTIDIYKKYKENNASHVDLFFLKEYSFPIKFLEINEDWTFKADINDLLNITNKLKELNKARFLLKEIQKYAYVGFLNELKPLIIKVDNFMDTANEFKELQELDSITHKNLLEKEPKKIKTLTKERIRRRGRGRRKARVVIEDKYKEHLRNILRSEFAKRNLSLKEVAELLGDSLIEERKIYSQLINSELSAALLLKIMDLFKIKNISIWEVINHEKIN